VAQSDQLTEHLTERFPELDAEDLVGRFVPPRRFAGVRLSTYVPDPAHPSQSAALAAMEAFVTPSDLPARRWFRKAPAEATEAPGRYLDGGYGVGKTHLLAGLWHAFDGPKCYLSFAELVATIGLLGMEKAVAAFSRFQLLCVDEFELDDVANTLMVVTFLRGVVTGGRKVAVTSNSLPDRLGEGRFSADDFRREIAAIAAHFETVRIEGEDFRTKGRRSVTPADALPDSDVDRVAAVMLGPVADDDFDALLDHLRRVHPARFAGMIDGLDAVLVRGLHPIAHQDDALRFVHLVDKLYDAEVTFAASGCHVGELFPESYRHGGYRKKYGRCESRLTALLDELRLDELRGA
jgi:cell division protein ZapE